MIALGSMLLSGCLSLEPDGADDSVATDSRSSPGDERSRPGSGSSISDVELTEVRDLGGPFEGPGDGFTPDFTWDGKFGGSGRNSADEHSTILLVSTAGNPTWESEPIEADYSFADHFLGSDAQYYVWYNRDGIDTISAFSAADGNERWTHEVAGPDDARALEEITTVGGTVCYSIARQDDQEESTRLTIRRLTRDGSLDWETIIRRDGRNFGLGDGGTDVYVALSTDLLRLDAAKGTVQDSWRIRPTSGGLYRHGDALYVDTSSGFTKFDLEDAGIAWQIEDEFLSGSPFRHAIAIRDGFLYHGSEDGWITAFETASGSRNWETRVPGAVSEIFLGENVVWALAAENLHVLDQTTGTIVTQFEDGQFRDIQVIEDTVVITDYDQARLYEVDEITTN